MNSEQKKALLLIKAIIFYYHKLNQEEADLLAQTAHDLDAEEALSWTYEFINSDFATSTSRARTYLIDNLSNSTKEEKFDILKTVWEDNEKKGYISEIEAVTMLKISKDWGLESQLLALARSKH
jgi:hypothetical protein